MPTCGEYLSSVYAAIVLVLQTGGKYGDLIQEVKNWDSEIDKINAQDEEDLKKIENFFNERWQAPLTLIAELENFLANFASDQVNSLDLLKLVDRSLFWSG
jgi:hypothetical protein